MTSISPEGSARTKHLASPLDRLFTASWSTLIPWIVVAVGAYFSVTGRLTLVEGRDVDPTGGIMGRLAQLERSDAEKDRRLQNFETRQQVILERLSEINAKMGTLEELKADVKDLRRDVIGRIGR